MEVRSLLRIRRELANKDSDFTTLDYSNERKLNESFSGDWEKVFIQEFNLIIMRNFSFSSLNFMGIISHDIQELESKFLSSVNSRQGEEPLKPYIITNSFSMPKNREDNPELTTSNPKYYPPVYVSDGDSDSDSEEEKEETAKSPEFIATSN